MKRRLKPLVFEFTLRGTSALLMHADDVEAADALSAWRKDPGNKSFSVPGDDRSPPWTWQTYLYTDGKHVVMPSANIMVALRSAGTQIILKKQKTFKEITQSGLFIPSEFCEFLVGGKKLPMKSIHDLRDLPFVEQAETVKTLGFSLYTKRAAIGPRKNVRVRPRFPDWQVRGAIHILAEEITPDVLGELFRLSGDQGLCDWRPGAKTPGTFGIYTSQVSAADKKVA